jgi:hypothetical protein
MRQARVCGVKIGEISVPHPGTGKPEKVSVPADSHRETDCIHT